MTRTQKEQRGREPHLYRNGCVGGAVPFSGGDNLQGSSSEPWEINTLALLSCWEPNGRGEIREPAEESGLTVGEGMERAVWSDQDKMVKIISIQGFSLLTIWLGFKALYPLAPSYLSRCFFFCSPILTCLKKYHQNIPKVRLQNPYETTRRSTFSF